MEGDGGIVRVKSAVPMAEAITRIKADIANKGIKFFSEIDQSRLAADAGIIVWAVWTDFEWIAKRHRITDRAAQFKMATMVVNSINDMLGWFFARTYAETTAWSKIIVDRTNDRILGAHFVRHGGQELINIFGPRDQVRHYRAAAHGQRLRLSDVFRRHQAQCSLMLEPQGLA